MIEGELEDLREEIKNTLQIETHLSISAKTGLNITKLIEEICANFPPPKQEEI